MRSPDCSYITRLHLSTTPDRVRGAVLRPEEWLPGWRHVQSLELVTAGNEEGVGRRYRTTVRAVAPYRLTWEMETTRAETGRIAWRVDGDLSGSGHLDIAVVDHAAADRSRADRSATGDDATNASRRATATAVEIVWAVRPTKRWMVGLWPVAGRLFTRNHHAIMRRGAGHLARHLDADLLRCEVSVEIRPPRG